jgi:tRNA pseudouridine13 synthase
LSKLPDWARALGPTLLTARIRTTPSDFVVSEQLDVEFSGDGEHDWLHIEKTGANTHWVTEQLARHAGVKPRDVGYAGLKDRHAVTRQWFSVRRPSVAGTDWNVFDSAGVRIVAQHQHRRKLKRGAHRGNAFRIALRAADLEPHRQAIAARLAEVESRGVPNYFGEQRFGRDAANIELARSLFRGRRLSRNKRSIALSAVRSLLFNEILHARVQDGSWERILPGERANLDGSGSVFAVEKVSSDIENRCAAFDIHPTAVLWGRGAPLSGAGVAALERKVLAPHEDLCDGLNGAKVDAASRSLRLRVRDLEWDIENGALWLDFRLAKGAYATAVLREIAATSERPSRRD